MAGVRVDLIPPSHAKRDAHGDTTLTRREQHELLLVWLSRAPPESRWDALERLAAAPTACVHRFANKLARMVDTEPNAEHADRLKRSRARRRRRAAIALLRLSQRTLETGDALQKALGKSLALALPRRLGRPTIVGGVLSICDCELLMREAVAEGRSRGWGSLHRNYSTQDMPIERLPSGARVRAALYAELVPEYPRRFGPRFEPAEALSFINLFIVRYTADAAEHGGQAGLAGHLDTSLLSFVLQLSPEDAFGGGGTSFLVGGCSEPVVIHPGQGSAVLFLGRVWHEALPICRGERIVLVGLLERRTRT